MNDLSIVRVLVHEPPRIVRVLTPGIAGPPGPQGPEGPPGMAYPYPGDAVKDEDAGTWSGTDHADSMHDWIGELSDKAASEGIPVKARIPRGKYFFSDAVIKLTDTFENLDIGGDGDATKLVINNPNGGLFIPAGTTTGQTTSGDIYLAQPAVLRDQRLVLNTTVGIVAGQWIILRDSAQPIYTYDSLAPGLISGYVGQAVRVRNVIDATQVQLDGNCEFAYGATTTTVTRYDCLDAIFFHDFAIDYAQDVAIINFAIDFTRCIHARAQNISFWNRKSKALRFNETFVFDVDGIRDTGANIAEAYTVEVQNSSCFGMVSRIEQKRGRHAFDAGGNVQWIPSAHVTVRDSLALHTQSNGFDTHDNCRNITFDAVRAVGFGNPDTAPGDLAAGVLIRGRNCRVINSEFTAFGVGVYSAYGGDNEIANNIMRRCRTGVRILQSDNNKVHHNLIYDAVENGIETSGIDGIPGLVFENNTIFGNPSNSGIYVSSPNWHPSWRIRGNIIPDAAQPYNVNVPLSLYTFRRSTAADYILKYEDGTAIPGITAVEAPRRMIERAVTSANTLTIPANADVPIAVGSRLEVFQTSTGITSIVPAAGVTINGLSTPWQLFGQNGWALLRQRAVNDWLAVMLPAVLKATASYDPPSLNAGESTAIQAVSVPGAALGDLVQASFNKDLLGVALSAWVSVADTVSFAFFNRTAAAVNVASGLVRVWVMKC